MRIPQLVSPEQQQRLHPIGTVLTVVGGLVLLASTFLPWAYSSAASTT